MRMTLAPLALVLLSGGAYAQSYSSIWSVGDSLSDTGRTYERTRNVGNVLTVISAATSGGGHVDVRQPVGPLYANGRFSNGSVWVEYLHGMNGLTYNPDRNLAWGGAVTGSARDVFISALIKHLEQQVDEDFRPQIDGETKGFFGTISGWFSNPQLGASHFGSSPLVTLWIGGNNFRQEVEDKDWHSAWFWSSQNFNDPKNAILKGVPENLRHIQASFLTRHDVGQNGITYYVPTVADVSTTPKFAGSPDYVRSGLGTAVQETNRELKAALYALHDEFSLQKPGTRIVVVDAAALLAEVQANPLPFGFTDAVHNCVDSASGNYANGCGAGNVGDYLFWDQFHPTTKAHNMIARYADLTDRMEAGRSVDLPFPYVANIEIRDRAFVGGIGGAAGLIKKGEATLTLAGSNTYRGGTRIDHGTVRVSNDRNLGAVEGMLTMRGGALNNSSSFTMRRDVRVDASVSEHALQGSRFGGTFNTDAGTVLTLQDNTLHGSGDIAKTGQGTLDLRSTMAEARELTAVRQGLLKVNTTNEYRSTEVNVEPDGALGGSGTIVGTVKNAGKIVPGNSVGTFIIDGDFVQEDSGRLVLDVDTDRADLLHVTGAATLGGSLRVELDPSDKILDQVFTFFTSDQRIHEEYDEVLNPSPFLTENLHYSPRSVIISFARDFRLPALTGNQHVMATLLNDAYSTLPQGDMDNVFFALDHTVTDAGGAAALDALSGSALGNAGVADALQRMQFMRAMEDRMADNRSGRNSAPAAGVSNGAGDDAAGVGRTMQWAAGNTGSAAAGASGGGASVWGRVFGGPGRSSGQHAFDMSGTGVLLGADMPVGPALAGISLGYGQMKTTGDDKLSRIKADAYQLSVYGSVNRDALFVDGTAAYTYVDYRTKRSLAFGGLSRQATGSPKGHDVSIAAKAGLRLALGEWSAEPSLGLDWYRLRRGGFQETGAGAASLDVAGETQNLVMPSVGVRLSHSFQAGAYILSPELRARYYHNLGDKESMVTASLAGLPGRPFSVSGAGLGRHLGVVGASLALQKSDDIRLFGQYDASFSRHTVGHTFSLGLRMTW